MELGGYDIIIPVRHKPEITLKLACGLIVNTLWSNAVFNTFDNDANFIASVDNIAAIDFDKTREIIVCENQKVSDEIDANGANSENGKRFIHLMHWQNSNDLTLVVDNKNDDYVKRLVAIIKRIFGAE